MWFAWHAYTVIRSLTLRYFSMMQCQSFARIWIVHYGRQLRGSTASFLFARNSINAEKRSALYKDARRSFQRVHLQNPISRWKHTLRRIIISMGTFPVLVVTHRNSKTHQISSTCFTVKGPIRLARHDIKPLQTRLHSDNARSAEKGFDSINRKAQSTGTTDRLPASFYNGAFSRIGIESQSVLP